VPELRIGVDLAGLRQPLKKALHTAARLGADAVEIDARGEISPQQLSQTALRQLRKMLEDLGLRVSAVRFRTRRGYDSTEALEPRIAATKAAMRMAYALGAGAVLNHLGRAAADQDSPGRKLLVEVLEDLGRYGQHAGALLAAETGTESGLQLAALLAQLPHGAIGADLDPGGLILHGFSPAEAVDALGPAILHVHATDAVPDAGSTPAQPVALGNGAVDLPALLGALEGGGYRGHYTIRATGHHDPEREIADALAYLRSL